MTDGVAPLPAALSPLLTLLSSVVVAPVVAVPVAVVVAPVVALPVAVVAAAEVETMMSTIVIGFIIAAISETLCKLLGNPSLSVPISILLTVTLATSIPTKLTPLVPSGELLSKLLLFFASVGNASGTISNTIATKGAIYLFGYGLILYSIHLLVVLGIGRMLLKIPMPDLLMACNANIGKNAATACSLATSKGWKNRLLPGILVGTFGNVIGTFAGLWLGTFVLKRIAGY